MWTRHYLERLLSLSGLGPQISDSPLRRGPVVDLTPPIAIVFQSQGLPSTELILHLESCRSTVRPRLTRSL